MNAARPGTSRLDDGIVSDLVRAYAGNAKGLATLLVELETELRSKIHSVEDAAHAGDLAAVHGLGHALKGVSAMFGAVEISSLSGKLQRLATQSDARRIATTLAQLDAELPRTMAELRRRTS
jgi:HPt (histidine-containing phosphotransfer) domain-containing protein